MDMTLDKGSGIRSQFSLRQPWFQSAMRVLKPRQLTGPGKRTDLEIQKAQRKVQRLEGINIRICSDSFLPQTMNPQRTIPVSARMRIARRVADLNFQRARRPCR